MECKYKKQLFENSLNATKAALQNGVVIGAGTALIRARNVIKNSDFSEEETIGADIVFKACESPIRQLVLNSGFESSVVLENVLTSGVNCGFNVLTGKVEDLLSIGVMDPTKVVNSVLQTAVSEAGMALLSEVLIATT